MKIINSILLAFLISFFACTPKGDEKYQGEISIIPKPVEMTTHSEGRFLLEDGLTIYVEKGNNDAKKVAAFLSEDITTVTGIQVEIMETEEGNLPAENGILLTSSDANVEQKEGYSLDITDQGVIIRAKSGAGLFYGMQTMKQLLPSAIYNGQADKEVVWELPLVSITDYPRFSWRGLHLDVGRHMSSVEFIKEYLDNMAMHKLNTFHWHLTEDQGWRIEIKQYPKLTEIGAYRDSTIIGHARAEGPKKYKKERYGGFYTQEEVKEIVAYAKERYITVIPEIELPGHATAAIAAYPELGTSGKRPAVVSTWGIFPDIFNIEDSTFIFLQNVLDEVMELFPSEYIHIGGDEAMKVQWEKSPEIQAKIKELGLKDEHELQSWFITRIEKHVNSKGRQIIGWDEILEGGLAPNAAVMSWRGEEGGIAAAKSGHNVVMSPTGYMYFDYHQGDPDFEPGGIGGFLPIEKVYSYNPTPESLTEEEQKYIMGAQANLWTEYLPTEESREYMIFPRVSALAEVVWTPQEKKDWQDFKSRLPKQFDRYEELGLNYAESVYYVTYDVEETDGGFQVTLKNQIGMDGMRYTADGSEPTASSTLYEAPVTIEKGTEIKAQLFVDGEPKGKFTSIVVGEE